MNRHPRIFSKRRLALAGSVLVLTLALAVLGVFAVWFFTPEPTFTDTVRPLDGRISALVVRFDADDPVFESDSENALQTLAAQWAQRASSLGIPALFVATHTERGALFRLDGAAADPALTEQDRLFQKADWLQTVCEAAEQAGLSVYALTEPGTVPAASLVQTQAALRAAYPIAGVAVASPDGRILSCADYLTTQSLPTDGADASMPELLRFETLDDANKTELLRFLLAGGAGAAFDGALSSDPEAMGAACTTISAQYPVLSEFEPSCTLGVTYPSLDETNTATLSGGTIFLVGTSDPEKEITCNGESVTRWGEKGMFGVLLSDLSYGDNVITLEQPGGETLSVTLYRPEPVPEPQELEPSDPEESSSASESTAESDSVKTQEEKEPEIPHDDTVEVPAGTKIRMDNAITSLLYDPSDNGYISETVTSGAVGEVASCAETTRSGVATWAYQLTSGDWVLASNTTVLENAASAKFTGASAQPSSAADNAEILTFTGTGTPLAYAEAEGSTLTLRFYGAEFSQDFAVSGSSFVKESVQTPFDGGTELSLTLNQPVWGWHVAYENDTVRLTLKVPPAASDNALLPLKNVRILLDAGHGGTDPGALGIGGEGAPQEKDLNLMAAEGARQRLEQLGAEVIMMRSDDVFFTLEERLLKISEVQPDFFLSLHHNSTVLTTDCNDWFGTECYYFYPSGKDFAEALTDEVCTILDRNNRGAYWNYYYVTRSSLCPSALLELGFVVSPADYESISDNTNLWLTADAIARAVQKTLQASA